MIDEPDEALDMLLAQHIARIHREEAEALDPVYSKEQLQAYIKFARAHRPVLGKEARQELTRSYLRLRTDDSTLGRKSSFKITVRQLEALVRLSEALARLHCAPTVLPKHVRTAHRLLISSIQTVETDDVQIEEDEEEAALRQAAEQDEAEQEAAAAAGADGASQPPPATQHGAAEEGAAKPKTKISGAKFNKLKRILLTRLKQASGGPLGAGRPQPPPVPPLG